MMCYDARTRKKTVKPIEYERGQPASERSLHYRSLVGRFCVARASSTIGLNYALCVQDTRVKTADRTALGGGQGSFSGARKGGLRRSGRRKEAGLPGPGFPIAHSGGTGALRRTAFWQTCTLRRPVQSACAWAACALDRRLAQDLRHHCCLRDAVGCGPRNTATRSPCRPPRRLRDGPRRTAST
jgi:hypothetical protein